MDQSINIDIDQFRGHCIGFLKLRSLSSRNFLQTEYLAYALCLGQSIKKKKIFFHHHHHIWILGPYLKDFPDSKIISMTRDPRATYVSGVEHWRKYDPSNHDNLRRVFFILNRTIEDAYPLKEYTTNFKVLKLEDLEDEQILNSICEWLGVSFDPCLRQSTWAGMRWWGDRISGKQPHKNELGFSDDDTKNALIKDVNSALQSLGYKTNQINNTLSELNKMGELTGSIEEVIRKALSKMI